MTHPIPPSFIVTPSHIAAYYNGKAYSANTSHPSWLSIRDAIKNKTYDLLPQLFDVVNSVRTWCNGKMVLTDRDTIEYKGVQVHDAIVSSILEMMREGFDELPMVNFLENVLNNPDPRAVSELWLFVESGGLTLTPDGCFLAFKRVRHDYMDSYSGTIRNAVGDSPEMDRKDVDTNRENTCSRGLHFCSITYLPSYGGTSLNGDHVMVVKVNPADVVSIPSDYKNTKGRAWKYTVVAEHDFGGVIDEHSNNPLSSAPVIDYAVDTDTNDRLVDEHEIARLIGDLAYNHYYRIARYGRDSNVPRVLIDRLFEEMYQSDYTEVDDDKRLVYSLSKEDIARVLYYAYFGDDEEVFDYVADNRLSADAIDSGYWYPVEQIVRNANGPVELGRKHGTAHRAMLTRTHTWNGEQFVAK